MLECELNRQFPVYRMADINRAVHQLQVAKLVAWTSQGWLISEAGIVMATGGNRMMFDRHMVR